MKTPRETALELIHKHHDKIADVDVIWVNILNKWILAKQCALISVDEIIKELDRIDRSTQQYIAFMKLEKYWTEVIEEIKKQ